MTQEEYQFCHIQEAPPFVEKAIEQRGYWIQKMEGCPSQASILPCVML
jgi:hypothetical protein